MPRSGVSFGREELFQKESSLIQKAFFKNSSRLRLDPIGDTVFSRTTIGRIVFKTLHTAEDYVKV